jgi:hypothetical protein
MTGSGSAPLPSEWNGAWEGARRLRLLASLLASLAATPARLLA